MTDKKIERNGTILLGSRRDGDESYENKLPYKTLHGIFLLGGIPG